MIAKTNPAVPVYYGADDGCEARPHCLTCDLPECVYDLPNGLASYHQALQDAELARLRAAGARIGELAEQFNLSRRTVASAIYRHQEKERTHAATENPGRIPPQRDRSGIHSRRG